MFKTLKSILSGGTVYTLIQIFKETQDGRKAWITLCTFYKGSEMVGISAKEACTKIQNMVYTGTEVNQPFHKYVGLHLMAHMLLDKNKVHKFLDVLKIDYFLSGIKFSKLEAAVAMAHANPSWNFTQVISFLHTNASNYPDAAASQNFQ